MSCGLSSNYDKIIILHDVLVYIINIYLTLFFGCAQCNFIIINTRLYLTLFFRMCSNNLLDSTYNSIVGVFIISHPFNALYANKGSP